MMAKLRAILVLGVTLIAGVAIGVTYERHRIDERRVSAVDTHHMIGTLTSSLALDSAQRRAIDAILARHQASVDSTWRELHPHVRATMDSALREIAAVLRPDQLAKFRAMVEMKHSGVLHR